MTVKLAAGRDVLASLRPLKRGQVVIAFAAETSDLERRGAAKREAKGADLIVINDVGRRDIGFESPDNEVILLGSGEPARTISRRPKRAVADAIWDACLKARAGSAPVSASASAGEAAASTMPEPRG